MFFDIFIYFFSFCAIICNILELEIEKIICYHTENYVCCSAVQVIYRIVFVYSVSKVF